MICCFMGTANGQNYALQLQRLSPDEGLSQGFVNQTLQDDLGYIWIATAQGLNRFDGYQVTEFNKDAAFSQSSIRKLFKTADGQIIVSTDYAGAFFINPVTLAVEQFYSGKLDAEATQFSSINAISQSGDTFYLGIAGHVYSYKKKHPQLVHEFSINKPEHIVRALTIDQQFLYIGTSNGLFSKHLGDEHVSKIEIHNKNEITPDSNNIKYLSLDQELGLMIGTVEGLYSIPIENNERLNISKKQTLLAKHNIWDYQQTEYGDFIATDVGLYEYHRESKESEFLLRFEQSKFTMSDNTILDLMVDKTGVIWLASRSQGVFSWSTLARRFANIDLENDEFSQNNIILSITQTSDNQLWLGTTNGVIKHNPVANTSKRYLYSHDSKASFGSAAVFDAVPAEFDNNASMWLLLYDGIALFDVSNERRKPLPSQGITSEIINTVPNFGYHLIAPDTFAFFTEKDYYIYDGKTGITRKIKGLREQLDPINSYAFLTSLPSHPNELVISTSGHLYRYNESTQQLTLIYKVAHFNPQTYVTINDWIIDYNNILWLASSHEGLIGIDATSYEVRHTLRLTNGLNARAVYALQFDRFGFLWFSSQNGLYRLDVSAMQLSSFSIKDGLAVNEFTSDASTELNDGRLVFGSARGALQLSPQDFLSVPNDKLNATTDITNITLFSRKLNYHPHQYNDKPLTLSADDMGLEVRFSNFDFQNIDKTRYKVTLDGPNSFSYDKLNNNKVFFTKLPAGKYTLSIASYLSDGTGLSIPRVVNFNVEYALWRSPIALALYAIATFLILFFMFWQYRARQLVIKQAHDSILDSQQQTELALNSSKSGVWELNISTHTTQQNRLKNELGYTDIADTISIDEFYAFIHPDDKRQLSSQWNHFLEQPDSQQWQATYRLKHTDGHWLWYQDIGKVIAKDEHDQPLIISGIYTNITEHRATEQQAAVLGDAFSQINDWLLLLDNQLIPFSANASFTEAFAINTRANTYNIRPFLRAISKAQLRKYIDILKSLKPKQNWRDEASITTLNNTKQPIGISVTAISKDNITINYYVVVISDMTEKKRAEDKLRYLANYDPLTKLPNRSLMYEKITTALEGGSQESAKLVALLFIDLDKFKPVNDSFGHAVGDQLLCDITQRVTALLAKQGILGRQSGDEFLLLIKNLDSPQALSSLVRALNEELAKKVIIDDFSINITASIGVALYPFDAKNADDLIRNADIAMMHAKQSGRNGFKFFTEQMNNQITAKLLLENALKDAFKDNLLFNNYQPIINTQTKNIKAVELLMRWQHNGEYISPVDFIPLAEELGLIGVLTEQALKRALRDLQPLLNANPDFYISLNLSPLHILKSNLTERLLMILDSHHIKPKQLRLEITENTLLDDKNKAAKQLNNLKNAGFKLLLDDFGTGYSSLTYLNQFPINVIKIDQSFVRNIGLDAGNDSIIKTIHSLARDLNLYCIAEGVETKEQIHFLQRIGCHDLQGYYFAKPTTAEQLLNEEFIMSVIKKIAQ